MKITWGGHATALIQIGMHRILTDPNLAERLFLFKRHGKPGLQTNDLELVSHIILSHAHLDHTDKATLKRIPRHATVFARGRITDIPHSLGFPIKPLEVWESIDCGGVKITCLPAQHFGGRWQINGDFHKYYFASFMIEAEGKVVYFGGDTGYGPHFLEIARKFPRIDVALMPIGAYEPRMLLHDHHASPEESFQGFLDLNANIMIPIHFGTFKLSQEPLSQPPKLLTKAAIEAGMQDSIRILKPGESYED